MATPSSSTRSILAYKHWYIHSTFDIDVLDVSHLSFRDSLTVDTLKVRVSLFRIGHRTLGLTYVQL